MVARLRGGPAQSGAGPSAAGPGFLAAALSRELRRCCEPLYKLGFTADLCLLEHFASVGWSSEDARSLSLPFHCPRCRTCV